jgi:hypothetical protein
MVQFSQTYQRSSLSERYTEVHKTFWGVWAVKCSLVEFSATALDGETTRAFFLFIAKLRRNWVVFSDKKFRLTAKSISIVIVGQKIFKKAKKVTKSSWQSEKSVLQWRCLWDVCCCIFTSHRWYRHTYWRWKTKDAKSVVDWWWLIDECGVSPQFFATCSLDLFFNDETPR